MMNPRIQYVRRWSAGLARDQVEPALRIDGRLVFGEHDQCRAALVEPGVHARGDLHAACQRETNVSAISHFVRSECALDFVDDFFARRDFSERESASRMFEPIQVFEKLEDSTAVTGGVLPKLRHHPAPPSRTG